MRRLPIYLVANALATTAMIAAVTISVIAAERMLGSATWSGLPAAASILGTAAGSRLIAERILAVRVRSALAQQYGIAALGAIAAIGAVLLENFALLVAGLFVVGVGNGATQYVRYLAADEVAPERRGKALSWIVWMGSFGAIVGPSLLAPTGLMAVRLGLPEQTGPYLVAATLSVVIVLLYATSLPQNGAVPLAPKDAATESSQKESNEEAAERWPTSARRALVVMICGHGVMVLVMTMTPLHLVHHGHALTGVGFVLSSHTAGMFLFAPVVGWLVDRVGSAPLLYIGAVLLAVACLTGALLAPRSTAAETAIPLFLLGLGWNVGFVAGSAQLTNTLPAGQRLRGRARADSWIWITAAASSLASSLLFSRIGFAQLAMIGLLFCVFMLLFLGSSRVRRSRSVAPDSPT